MKGKPVKEFKDHVSIVPKSCSNFMDCFALDVPNWAECLYKKQEKSYLYVPAKPNKPSGR